MRKGRRATRVDRDASTSMMPQLEQLWRDLEMPMAGKMEFLDKYSQAEHAQHLVRALPVWRGAAAAVLARDRLQRLLRYVREHENEPHFFDDHDDSDAEAGGGGGGGGGGGSGGGGGGASGEGGESSSSSSSSSSGGGGASLLNHEDAQKLAELGCFISKTEMFGFTVSQWLAEMLRKVTVVCCERLEVLEMDYGDVLTLRGNPYLRSIEHDELQATQDRKDGSGNANKLDTALPLPLPYQGNPYLRRTGQLLLGH